jgi:hypothetical protein
MASSASCATAPFITPEFRASYMNVFEPGKANDKGIRKYEVSMLFPKGADLSLLKKAAIEVMTTKFGPDQAKWPKNVHSPFRDQGEKSAPEGEPSNGYEKGAIFTSARSNKKPGIVGTGNPPQPLFDATLFYSGCYAKAQIHAYWFDVGTNKGVTFGLDNIQMTRKGDPLGNSSSRSAETAFEPIADADAGGGTNATSLFG